MLLAVSSSMMFAVSPFLITGTLGLSVAAMGIIEGFTEACAQFFRLHSGFLSDKNKTKPVLFWSVFIASVSKLLFCFGGLSIYIALSKFLERISNGSFGTARDAYVGKIALPGTTGNAFGRVMTGRTIGAIIGPVCISFLYLLTENYMTAIWVSFIPICLSFFLIKKLPDVEFKTDKKISLSIKKLKLLPGKFWRVVILSFLFMLGRFSDGLLVLRLKEMGASNFICLSTIAIFNSISALCCIPLGVLSDKYTKNKAMIFPFVTLVLSHVCFLFDSFLAGMAGVVFWGCQRGTSQLLFSSAITDSVKKENLGTALGFYYFVSGIASISIGLMIGFGVNDMGLKYCFALGSVFSLLALILLFVFNSKKGNRWKKYQ